MKKLWCYFFHHRLYIPWGVHSYDWLCQGDCLPVDKGSKSPLWRLGQAGAVLVMLIAGMAGASAYRTPAANSRPSTLWSACFVVGITSTAISPNRLNASTTNPILVSVSGDAMESNNSPINTTHMLRELSEDLALMLAGFVLALIWKRK